MDTPPYYDALLLAHAVAGGITLAGAVAAIGSRLFGWPHRWHIVGGNAFSLGMLGVALSGLGITIINPSLFLLSLAVFLLYLVVMGWRHAKARQGIGSTLDKIIVPVSFILLLAMALWGLWLALAKGNGMGWVVFAFGAIGTIQSSADLRSLRGKPPTGKERIIAHLSRMLGGTIGVVTAFLLVQLETNSILVWLAPTFLVTPLIFMWSAKIRGGWLPKRRPPEVES